MNHKVSIGDNELLKAFESCQLDITRFHHREHIQLAYVLLVKFDTETAYKILKADLLKFLTFNKVDLAKYHETMTYAWLLAVKHFMVIAEPSPNFSGFIEKNSILLDQGIMLSHYSRELLYSMAARKIFLEPDLESIPYH